ncbi:Atg27p [Arthroderma uncinatum]|uniref:Atg27p n=1 Tax=Arthroderma uncinatum TaxID=74035 RepID=UPI00144A5848|nr:Atg27p [Arthroderma uncinatum]KAF3481238.1 Atg27p [Arthroderma uncinatum]
MARHQGLSVLSLLALFSTFASADLDCTHIKVDGVSWDLSKLGGAHALSEITGDFNTTYTLDICKPLTKSMCKKGAYGNFVLDSGKTLDPIFTRLKKDNPEKEGLRMELHGGKHPFKKEGKNQKAVFNFLCDPERTGLEGLTDAKPESGNKDEDKKGDDKKGDDKKGDDKKGDDKKEGKEEGKSRKREEDSSKSLQLKGYNQEEGVLNLEWRTKYACEDVEGGGGNKSSGHWGFFTWMIVLLFLCTSAYLIFGSWLNYSRYGARGWDLLPHSDTIRDVPYILKDWARRVLNTLQGGGTRGGYSAV